MLLSAAAPMGSSACKMGSLQVDIARTIPATNKQITGLRQARLHGHLSTLLEHVVGRRCVQNVYTHIGNRSIMRIEP
jgi:hypothetical protein